MYKISVNNLGYENEELGKLDGCTGTLKELKSKLAKVTNSFRVKSLDGFKIEYLKEIKEENFKDDDIVVLQVINVQDRNITIWKE